MGLERLFAKKIKMTSATRANHLKKDQHNLLAKRKSTTMHRAPLLQTIRSYQDTLLPYLIKMNLADPEEESQILSQIQAFVESSPDCFDRRLLTGHVTGSAIVIHPDYNQVVLTLHAKLDLWLQLGGHCDNDPDVVAVAKKEVEEESGLKHVWIYPNSSAPIPIDFDIHSIPKYQDTPAHLHYDVRFLMRSRRADIKQSIESHDLKWFNFAEAFKHTNTQSMKRLLTKAQHLQSNL